MAEIRVKSRSVIDEDYYKDNKVLNHVGPWVLHESMFPYPYYLSGVKEFDENFSDYIQSGMHTMLTATTQAIHFDFAKPNKPLGGIFIDRRDIINFSSEELAELSFAKISKSRAAFKKSLKVFYTGGLVPAAIGAVSRKGMDSINIPIENSRGRVFELNYYNSFGQPSTLKLYVKDEDCQLLLVFLNTYYKTELSEEAKKSKIEDSSCFIATATYQDLYSPEVITFRNFRDKYLRRSFYGRAFIRSYYYVSPSLSKYVFKIQWLRKISKYYLDKLYLRLNNRAKS